MAHIIVPIMDPTAQQILGRYKQWVVREEPLINKK
jgi:hypothetical protein